MLFVFYYLFLRGPSRDLDWLSYAWKGLSEASNGSLQNRHGPSEACHLLIFTNCLQWKTAALNSWDTKLAPRTELRREISPSSPLLSASLRFTRTAFPLHPTKGLRTFRALKRSPQVGRGNTNVVRALSCLQLQRTLPSAKRSSQQMASSVDGGFS